MNRIVYADYLRIIGILGVIGVHLGGDYLSHTPLFSGLWYQGVIYSSFMRSGAILFIMVSGLLLLDRPQSIDKLPHRISRVMTPFIFWFLIIFLKLIYVDHYFTATSVEHFISQFIVYLLNPWVVSEEFWYIYMIIGFYLMLPILYKWISNTDEREIEYFLVLWFAMLLLKYFNVQIMLLDFVNLFVGHLGYFILGYYLSKKESKYTNNIWIGVILFLFGTFLVFLSMYVPTMMSQQLDLTYIGQYNLSPGSVFKAMGMFLILKNLDYGKIFGKRVEKVNNFAMKFAEISYGLYLAHIVVPIQLIYNVNLSPFINIPLFTLIIVVVVWVVLIIMNRIPILQKFTGMKAPS